MSFDAAAFSQTVLFANKSTRVTQPCDSAYTKIGNNFGLGTMRRAYGPMNCTTTVTITIAWWALFAKSIVQVLHQSFHINNEQLNPKHTRRDMGILLVLYSRLETDCNKPEPTRTLFAQQHQNITTTTNNNYNRRKYFCNIIALRSLVQMQASSATHRYFAENKSW